MGIVEKELSNIKLSTGESWRIEYTSKEDIHIHVDSAQIKMSQGGFVQFIDGILKAREELLKYKVIEDNG